MQIAILGRQPEIGLAELRAVYGHAELVLPQVALVKTEKTLDIDRLGGTRKTARVIATKEMKPADVIKALGLPAEGKITLGVSVCGVKATAKTANVLGMNLKKELVRAGRSVRLLPSKEAEVSDAASLHNRLGAVPAKKELIYVYSEGRQFLAELTGVQNLNAYAARDQERPKRDARVGMLPPKLAQVLVNLAVGSDMGAGKVVLDPFCGTGVVLQEVVLMGMQAYGTDLEPRMIEYSKVNLEWLGGAGRRTGASGTRLEVGDATKHKWKTPISAVASEIYLGQPFSTVPSEEKLGDVKHVTGQILRGFLKNIGGQIEAGTVLALACPAWRRADGSFSRLPLDFLANLGYTVVDGEPCSTLLYYREKQIVARDIIVLRKV
ncbi:hypothetical protein FWH13_02590 [Candidatus Saccharibacteria bacterium]|nr:hypothetical protein [Candidatus Saccharibacteria bacterium]